MVRGRWVEIDRERLEAMMQQYRKAEQLAAEGGMTFCRGHAPVASLWNYSTACRRTWPSHEFSGRRPSAHHLVGPLPGLECHLDLGAPAATPGRVGRGCKRSRAGLPEVSSRGNRPKLACGRAGCRRQVPLAGPWLEGRAEPARCSNREGTVVLPAGCSWPGPGLLAVCLRLGGA
jgi:hypothetical protein